VKKKGGILLKRVLKMNEVEKRYASLMRALAGVPPGIDHQSDQPWWPAAVRESMRRTAYHEAGHFAARLFTQLEVSHVVSISIIGNKKLAGYVRVERSYTYSSLKSYPPPSQRIQGGMLLLEMLAGSGAEMILFQSEERGSIFDYWEGNTGDDSDEEGTDFFKAFRIAEIMAKPYMPVNRILKLADKWTLEMLRIPAVWKAVETVAGKLIKQGEIAHDELYDLVDDSVYPNIIDLPKWRRRFSFTREEKEKYVERG
jgi:hypothetical protein